jgi:hypothetical protein
MYDLAAGAALPLDRRYKQHFDLKLCGLGGIGPNRRRIPSMERYGEEF